MQVFLKLGLTIKYMNEILATPSYRNETCLAPSSWPRERDTIRAIKGDFSGGG